METEKLKWPFNLIYEVNKEIEDEHERLPETDDAAPKDLLAVIAYIFTRIATTCTTKTRIQGASFILGRYRDHKRVAEIAEEYGVSTALRTYFFASIASSDILATDWEVCDGPAV